MEFDVILTGGVYTDTEVIAAVLGKVEADVDRR